MGCSHSAKNICNNKDKTNMISPLDKINIGDILGKGQFGEVYEIICIENINKLVSLSIKTRMIFQTLLNMGELE